MPKATMIDGDLIEIRDCYIRVGDAEEIRMKILPDISDAKSASYASENAIGRSSPFHNFSHSELRTISWSVHFMVCKDGDQETILNNLRILESATYPRNSGAGTPYSPPPICHIKCGTLLGDGELCAILKSYSTKFDTTVPWGSYDSPDKFFPYKIDVDLQFEVVYDQQELPGAERVMDMGF